MTKPKQKQTHYFAHDGNYGCAENLVVIVTENFTEGDWALIDLMMQGFDWNYTVEFLKILSKHRN
jgi:hypothetical protein